MLREDINEFLNTIPNDVCIVAATKYVDSNQNTNSIISSTTPTYNSNNTTSTPIITRNFF